MELSTLEGYGINYRRGLARCMNDEKFYRSMLALFLEDTSFERAREALGAGDLRAMFRCAHELKGVCGNVDLTELYDAVCPLVELLRNGGGTLPEAAALFARMEAAYARARTGVALMLAD